MIDTPDIFSKKVQFFIVNIMAKQLAALKALEANLMSQIPRLPWEIDTQKIKENDPSVTEIDWGYTGITSEGIADLAAALKDNTHLQKISVCF